MRHRQFRGGLVLLAASPTTVAAARETGTAQGD